MSRTDLASSIALVIFGLAVAFESWRMPRFESIGGSILNAPGLVPGILGVIIALLGAVMLTRTLLAQRRRTVSGTTAAATVAPDEQGPPDTLTSGTGPDIAVEGTGGLQAPSNTRVLVALVLGVVFGTILIGRMPFWLAVFVFVFASIVYNERAALKTRSGAIRILLIAGAIAGATGFAVPFVFERIFLVTLP
ncbi:MAG TPA: hypothetical protein PLT07_00260 [Trueperaceae bacterium]|nr:hypothetical protein [Trueperaceae bacterium]